MSENESVVIYVSGAIIAVAWIWFAFLGIRTVGIMTALFVAIGITIILGALIGGLQKKKMNTDIEIDKQKARAIAELRYWFRWHVIIYIIVNIGLFGLWYLTGPIDFLWPLLPVGFWALGLIAHYLIAYRSVGGGWIEKETEKILQDSS